MTGTDDISAFEQALLATDRTAAAHMMTCGAADDPLVRLRMVDRLVVPAMDHLGQAWEEGEVSLAQLYLAGRLCEQLVDELYSSSADVPRRDQPRLAIAVLADHHVLGKRIVRSVLRASGLEVLDLGHGLDVSTLVERVAVERVELLLISVLMLPSALKVGELRARLGREVRLIVGGAPFRLDERLGAEVGADATGRSGGDAVRIVRMMMEAGHV
jgi:methanogenic corrinoid protein MtbC1